MTHAIVPISQLTRRPVEHGRIRIGKKDGGKPSKLDTFRFTSTDESAIKRIAELYGGNPEVWSDAPVPGTWQVITARKEIPVALGDDPLGGTPIYEMWASGGCMRRCDGVMADVPAATDGGGELATVPCICAAQKAFACKVKTRLSVILTEVPFGGTWRIEAAGWNAAHELPGMVDVIHGMQRRGFVRALLGIDARVEKKPGEKFPRRYNVPVLKLSVSADELAAGGAAMAAIAPPPVGELPMLGLDPGEIEDQGPGGTVTDLGREWFDSDDEPVDAEIVEDGADSPGGKPVGSGSGDGSTPSPSTAPSSTSRRRAADPLQAKLVLTIADLAPQLARELGMVVDEEVLRHALAHKVSEGRTQSTTQLENAEKSKILDAIESFKERRVGPQWFKTLLNEAPL